MNKIDISYKYVLIYLSFIYLSTCHFISIFISLIKKYLSGKSADFL